MERIRGVWRPIRAGGDNQMESGVRLTEQKSGGKWVGVPQCEARRLEGAVFYGSVGVRREKFNDVPFVS